MVLLLAQCPTHQRNPEHTRLRPGVGGGGEMPFLLPLPPPGSLWKGSVSLGLEIKNKKFEGGDWPCFPPALQSSTEDLIFPE